MDYKNIFFCIDDKKINILGSFIRAQREEEKLSLSFVSEMVGVNKGYLSEIENGKKMPAEYTCNQIMKFLSIDFDKNDKICTDLFFELLNIYIHYLENDLNRLKTDCEKVFEKYKKENYGYFIYLLIEFIYAMIFKKQDDLEIIGNMLMKYSDIYDSNYKLILYDVISIHKMRLQKFADAKYLLIEASELQAEITKGMVYYHLTIVYQSLNLQRISLKNNLKSVEHFTKDFNHYRILYLGVYKANAFSSLYMFEEAEKLYREIIFKATNLKIRKLKITALNNLSWTYIKKKDYKNALICIEESILQGTDFQDINFYKPICYFKLGYYDDACKFIEEYLKNNKENDNNDNIDMLLKSIKFYIEDDMKSFKQQIIKYYEYKKSINDYEMQNFLLDFMLDIFEDIKEINLLCQFQKEQITLLKSFVAE